MRSGLGLILRGWVLMIASFFLAAFAIVMIFGRSSAGGFKLGENSRDLCLFLTAGFLVLAWVYSYGCIIVGHWRCLMNAPERRGAKWLMFACMTCILAVPTLNFASGTSGLRRQPVIKRGLEDVGQVEFTSAGKIMSAASLGCEVLSTVLFMLFLRAVGRCFDDRACTHLVDLYLGLLAVMVVSTTMFLFGGLKPAVLAMLALPLLAGWGLCFAGYLALLGVIRGGIRRGLGRLKSPVRV